MVLPSGPLRRLAAGTLASSIGTGAWYTSWALFLTRSVGLTPAEVGVGLTVAGGMGLLAAAPLGRLADRVGAREVYGGLLAVQAVAALAYLGVGGFPGFVAVACLGEVARGGAGGARTALVIGLSGGRDELGALGALRSVSHVGWAAGAAVGAVVVGLDSRPAYVALLVLNAASFVIYAALVASVPRVGAAAAGRSGTAGAGRATGREVGASRSRSAAAGRAAAGRRPPRVVHDRPYLTLAGLVGVLALCWAMLSSGLPLWVALHTDAPRWIPAVIVVVNSLAIALFQVNVSRRMDDPLRAARGAVLSGGALAASCGLFALTAGGDGPLVVALLLAGGMAHVAGELLFVAASWGLSIPLMPRDAAGEYQGVFATGEAAALLVAPVLMTTLVAEWGAPGWLVLAGIFLVPAAAALPATRWALATRLEPAGI